MAVNIFERYGIKEVANVSLFALADDKANGILKGDVVLYLDTLKVSTTETTAENVSAQGGWGNPKLVTWDYGKDINVTLEDAVVSWEELRIIQGGKIRNSGTDGDNKSVIVEVNRTAEWTFAEGEPIAMPTGDGMTEAGKAHFPTEDKYPEAYSFINLTTGRRGQYKSDDPTLSDLGSVPSGAGEYKIRFFWTEKRDKQDEASEIIISPNTFPGTYRVVGDALIRSEATGADEAFQFVINKAKMLSEVTLNMQAEGDPSTFSMTLNVLRDNDGNMMSLIKYN